MTIRDFVGRSFAAIVLFAALGLPTPSHSQPTASDEFLSYTGRAEALQGHGFLYGEKHILVLRGGKLAERVVLYTCRDGSAFARKKSFYGNGWSPDFVLDDASNGMREGVRSEGGGRQVFFRAARSDHERSKSLEETAGLVIDTGFDAFVRDNWQPLMAKDGLSMRFLIPSHLSDMEFRVQHVRADHVDGVPVEVFRLTLSNIFGWFVPGIDVYYTAQDHVLVRYVGISDLMDASGSNIRADITFALAARRATDEHDLATALQTRLMPCH
jgi:hypothetical protein